jgi:mRNA-degrading endonuclease RelE of RelBE toxin-antitoxin system
VKSIVYEGQAAKALRRYGNMAGRIRKAVSEYAADPLAHANNVTELVGDRTRRLRVGDFRVIVVESEAQITVVKIGPRGNVYS